MTKPFYILLFIIGSYFNTIAQNSVNDYKYVIVPAHFDFLSEKDQFQLNSLTKFLFNKYGYMAYMQDEELPEDLNRNRCLALTTDVVKDNALFKTKLQINLKDCNGRIVQSSKVGESREKQYDKAYNLALRDAFVTFQYLNYKYQPNPSITSKSSLQMSPTNLKKEEEEIARLKEEIKSLKNERTVGSEESLGELTEAGAMDRQTPPKKTEADNLGTNPSHTETLYAQAIGGGFQIVDSTPKVTMILLSTGAKDVYVVKDRNAIVFKKDGQWMYSENDGKTHEETVLQLKF